MYIYSYSLCVFSTRILVAIVEAVCRVLLRFLHSWATIRDCTWLSGRTRIITTIKIIVVQRTTAIQLQYGTAIILHLSSYRHTVIDAAMMQSLDPIPSEHLSSWSSLLWAFVVRNNFILSVVELSDSSSLWWPRGVWSRNSSRCLSSPALFD